MLRILEYWILILRVPDVSLVLEEEKKNDDCDYSRAVSFSENGVRPAGNDLRWLRSYNSRQVRDAGRWKELPRGMSFVCRVCVTAYAFMFHSWAKTLLSKRLRTDLRCEVCTLHGEDQLLGFRIKGAGFGLSRGVFRVLHVRPSITSWHPVFPPSGTTDLSKGLRARVVPEQSSRLVTIVVFRVSIDLFRYFSFLNIFLQHDNHVLKNRLNYNFVEFWICLIGEDPE